MQNADVTVTQSAPSSGRPPAVSSTHPLAGGPVRSGTPEMGALTLESIRSNASSLESQLHTLCRQHARGMLRMPPGNGEVDALVDSVVEVTVDSVLQVVRALLQSPARDMPPPTLTVVRGRQNEPVAFRCGGEVLAEGRAGDQWEIMQFLVENAGRPLTVKEVQRAVDGESVPVREKVVRTRIAEIARQFPGALLVEKTPGGRHKRYRFVAKVVDARVQH